MVGGNNAVVVVVVYPLSGMRGVVERGYLETFAMVLFL
jgi:hypothetical protein